MTSFPVSALVAAAFLLATFAVAKYSHFRQGGFIASGLVAGFILVEGIWSCGLVHSVVFALVLAIFLFYLGLALYDGAVSRQKSFFSHCGLFVVVFASFFGSGDVERYSVALQPCSKPTLYAYSRDDGALAPLPFELSLEDFQTEYYPLGQQPRQYRSRISVDGHPLEISVNHPKYYRGYHFFQSGYKDDYSVIGISRDPWLPGVYLGMVLLMVGSILMLSGRWKMKVLIPIIVALAAVFSAISLARIRLGTLPPALRSLWFVPHLIVYMLAYAIMAVSLVLSFLKSEKLATLAPMLVKVCSALLLVGMLCGSVWAQRAWGDYWTWDPKECFAALTWLLTLGYIHIPSDRKKLRLAVLILAFIALQFTWYGVNYLPSASNSLHTYNL